MHKQTLPVCTLSDFSSWLYNVAEAPNGVLLPRISHAPDEKSHIRNAKERGFLNVHATEVSSNSNTPAKSSCCFHHGDCSSVANCRKFMEASRAAKWAAVKENHLYRRCLRKHAYSQCKSPQVCGINNCNYKHQRLLHNDEKDAAKARSFSQSSSKDEVRNVDETDGKVSLYGNHTQIQTFAFLDDGSSLTLMDEDIVRQLNMKCTKQPLCLKWTGNTRRYEKDSELMSLYISGIGSNTKKFPLVDVHTVKELQLPTQLLDPEKLKSELYHFRGLPIKPYANAQPRLVIGPNNIKLGIPLKCREDSPDQPDQTRMGGSG